VTPSYQPVAPARLWRHTLTPCVAAVTELVSYGLSNPEIAGRLFVVESTVKSHVSTVFAKTETRNRVQLARWWWEHVEHPEPTS
jgi:DNA-binding NarL/FixJ family response regulator